MLCLEEVLAYPVPVCLQLMYRILSLPFLTSPISTRTAESALCMTPKYLSSHCPAIQSRPCSMARCPSPAPLDHSHPPASVAPEHFDDTPTHPPTSAPASSHEPQTVTCPAPFGTCFTPSHGITDARPTTPVVLHRLPAPCASFIRSHGSQMRPADRAPGRCCWGTA